MLHSALLPLSLPRDRSETGHRVLRSHVFLLTVEIPSDRLLNRREERRTIDSPFTAQRRLPGHPDRQTDGVVTGHAGSADSENVGTRADARLGHDLSIQQIPGEVLQVRPGALYPALSRSSVTADRRMGRDRRRRRAEYDTLTRCGRSQLERSPSSGVAFVGGNGPVRYV